MEETPPFSPTSTTLQFTSTSLGGAPSPARILPAHRVVEDCTDHSLYRALKVDAKEGGCTMKQSQYLRVSRLIRGCSLARQERPQTTSTIYSKVRSCSEHGHTPQRRCPRCQWRWGFCLQEFKSQWLKCSSHTVTVSWNPQAPVSGDGRGPG